MTTAPTHAGEPTSQLRKSMGFWDVLLFNIATVLGPRWIAAAGHNGTSSISLWVLAAVFFFVPGALVINELSSRFPEEGGLYAWARDAFGPFHGFIAGWTYWIYTVFYFPGLLLASASMSAYIAGGARRRAGAEPCVSDLGFAGAAAGGRGAQHHRPQRGQMAAERGRRGHLCAAADPGRRGRGGLPAPWLGHAFHARQHAAHVELGHGELLVADRLCVHRAGAGFGHERRGARSAAHAAARGLRRRRAHRPHVHCRNLRRAGAGAGRRPRSAERRLSRHRRRLGRAAHRHSSASSRRCWSRWAMRAAWAPPWPALRACRSMVGIDRYLPAAFGKIHPEVEDAVHFDSGAGHCSPAPSCW